VIAPAVVAAPVNETSVGDTHPEPFRRPAIDAPTLRGAGRVGRLVVVLVLVAFGVFGPAAPAAANGYPPVDLAAVDQWRTGGPLWSSPSRRRCSLPPPR